jgi:hypothetical protein
MVWVSKKGIKVRNNLLSVGMDYSINKILSMYHIPFGVTLQNVLQYHPYEIAISVLAMKLGITNKIIITIILAFIL